MALVIPVEICDMVVEHITTPDADHVIQYSLPFTLKPDARARLLSLRLVSKSFCAAASPRLFQHIIAPAQSSTQGQEPFKRLVEVSRSEYAVYVRHLETGHGKSGCYNSATTHGKYIRDVDGLLSLCLAKLPDLRSIRFDASCETMSSDERKTAVNTIASALGYVPLPKLQELEISFPLAIDFGSFFPYTSTDLRIPIRSILRNLKHLVLGISVFTGYRGQQHTNKQVLPAYRGLENRLHAAHIARLVELAPNLDSLSITCTDVLPFHNIRFSPSLHLSSLSLTQALITSDHFRALAYQCKEHLNHIHLHLVQLESGTWHDLLRHLARLPHLIDFRIQACGYPSTGRNANLADRLPHPESSEPLESKNQGDHDALRKLEGRVSVNRASIGLSIFL